MKNFKHINISEKQARPVCRHPSVCPTCPCRRGGGPGVLPNLLKEDKKEEYDEEKKKDDVAEEEMEGNRRVEEDIQGSLVVENGMLVKSRNQQKC